VKSRLRPALTLDKPRNLGRHRRRDQGAGGRARPRASPSCEDARGAGGERLVPRPGTCLEKTGGRARLRLSKIGNAELRSVLGVCGMRGAVCEGRRQCGWAQNSFPPAVVQAFGSETYESLTRVPNLSLTPRLGGVGGVGPIMMCLTRSRCTPSKERNQTAIRDQSITFGQLYCLQARKCSSGPLCLTVYGLLRAPVEEGSPE
jgi:hypothetical protein